MVAAYWPRTKFLAFDWLSATSRCIKLACRDFKQNLPLMKRSHFTGVCFLKTH